MTAKHVLIIDNNIDQENGQWPMGRPFRRYLKDCTIEVRRGPQEDFDPKKLAFTHLLLSGSKTSCLSRESWVERELDLIRNATDNGRTVLGICFGHQLIARAFAGAEAVKKSQSPEFGWIELAQGGGEHPLLKDLPRTFTSFQSHNEEVVVCPPKFKAFLSSQRCAIQAIAHLEKRVFGLQFHPERNFEEGKTSIQAKLKDKRVSKDCIFNPSHAKSFYSDEIAQKIFERFLKLDV